MPRWTLPSNGGQTHVMVRRTAADAPSPLASDVPMTVHATSPQFKENARVALADEHLQSALAKVRRGFIEKRRAAAERLPEFERLRDQARDIKNHTLAHLDLYLGPVRK